MIEKFRIASDPQLYLAWPDVALTAAQRLVCIFSACTHHGDRSFTRVMLTDSVDRGRSWTQPRPLSNPLDHDPAGWFWNCARISKVSENRLLAVCDKIRSNGADHSDGGEQTLWMWTSDDDGQTWQGPAQLPVFGIVPDKIIELQHAPHTGRWLLSAHSKKGCANGIICAQRAWWSDDRGLTWQGPTVVAQSDRYFFCEGSTVELPAGELVCFLRENSMKGYDAFKAISRDGGATWSDPVMFPLPGCHRPVAGVLATGDILITHRFLQGGKNWLGYWTQNFFAGLTDVDSCLANGRGDAHSRILPIDFDRSSKADTGYSGWVQFGDGEIYIVNYLVDDHEPLAQIRGYSLRLSDFLLRLPVRIA